jgi:hypothetical protein
MNLVVLIQSARSAGSPPSWVRPVIIFGLLFLATFYWLIIWVIDKSSNENSPLEIRIVRDGIEVQDADEQLLQKAKLEGNARVIVYEVGNCSKSQHVYIVFERANYCIVSWKIERDIRVY